ncbi:MAG: shikimate dehydrogenase [Acidobacteria bacterium]|nr:shikimate dehydrogenase [Acidobacteriota bacterium]
MNNGKICISVCATNADEMLEQIRRAEKLADVIEIRLDCIESKQIHKAFAFLSSKKPLLLTYRPKEQGGKAEADLFSRKTMWTVFVINGLNDLRKLWFDYEYDLINLQKVSNPITIKSFHDFLGVPENLSEIFENLSAKSEVAKIAVQADDIADSLAVWKLLEKAKAENKQLIPIAMGEAGKWTRILGLAHGAFMTYASLGAGNETASGQISAKDLIEIYRVKELNEKTEIYGIVGNPVSHSLSPFMHNAAFKFHNLNAVYIPFEVKNLDEFIKRFLKESSLNIKGFSVTVPHKQAIIKHLDFVDETAKAIGAVNTVKIENGKLCGYNTDADGFIEPLKNAYGDLKDAKVAVLGSGGAARACIYALKKEGAEVKVFARNLEKAKSLTKEFQISSSKFQRPKTKDQKPIFKNYKILVNTTPLGTTGELENETPVFAEQIESVKLVYDLVYNPSETRLIKEARKANVPIIGGLAMLVAQGIKQFEIWTGKDVPIKEMSATVLKKLSI